jgi:ribosomal protein L11 methyltransferase
MRHIRLRFEVKDPAQIDLLTGILSSLGCSGFEETEEGFGAYAEEGALDLELLDKRMNQLGVKYSGSTIEETNWNALWESSFEPVVIPGKVVVRAAFHPPVQDRGIEIVITPRMSFGTGHHATTWLMLSVMSEIDLKGRDVLDFGSGTGILSIMAERQGARSVDAVDNDPGCQTNAAENSEENGCLRIVPILADTVPADKTYDIILANINRNVILAEADRMASGLRPGGRLLLSGLLVEDGPAVTEAFAERIGNPSFQKERGGWILIAYAL